MRFDVISLFPKWVNTVVEYGVIQGAQKQGLVELKTWNPRDFTEDNHQTVDDRPYGGGPGMVLKFEPLYQCIQAVKAENKGPVIYLSPQGQPLNQVLVKEKAILSEIILIAGRYEGIDQRLIESVVDEEWSLGDYVISGGELAAMVVIDTLSRLIPGVLGHEDSAEQDSFSDGLLDCPHYTRPENLKAENVMNLQVPEVLLSGNHQAIAKWRRQQALGQTWEKRPELLDSLVLSEQDKVLLAEYQQMSELSTKED